MRLIHWFRRDLRLADNAALDWAARETGGEIIPVFIFDERILRDGFVGAPITAAMLEMLAALGRGLRQRGGELLIRHGPPLAALRELLAASGADGVVWNRDYIPYAVRRDSEVKRALREAGYLARSFHDAVLVEPEGLLTKGQGAPYSVYGAYARRWGELAYAEAERVRPAPASLAPPPAHLERQPPPSLSELGFRLEQRLPPAGEEAAAALLREFAAGDDPPIVRYGVRRELPAETGTSGLSMHLRMGTISPRTCLAAALDLLASPLTAERRAGVDTWISELAWRDFYHQFAFHFPHALAGPHDPRFAAVAWRDDEDDWRAWCLGRTGYPIVDAAQRQLLAEGWMHNRARMISASFLVKHLLIDWRRGERHFMNLLRDGDPALNNGGWQWAAGTGGPSAQPYWRILNPIAQGQKHDPLGAYVRRYVPELAGVPDRFIHTPWELPRAEQLTAGADYPAPIVDQRFGRERALAAYRAALGEPPSPAGEPAQYQLDLG